MERWCASMGNKVRIKICGMTRAVDALEAAAIGVDAIGLVFADSPRRVDVAAAREIVKALPPFIGAVGVFVNSPVDEIRRIGHEVGLTDIQLHGDEPPDVVAALAPLRVIKAIRVRDRIDPATLNAYIEAGASAVLLDAWSNDARGGTGQSFDWHALSELGEAGGRPGPIRWILAGGLNPGNVERAIRGTRPWGVDVSSGVEESPGVKCAKLTASFVEAVQQSMVGGSA